MPRRQRGLHRDPAAMPAHELHEPDAIRARGGLGVGGVDSLHCFGARGLVAEGPVQNGDVVVNCLRHANDRTIVVDLVGALEDLHGATVGSVASDDEELGDLLLLQDLCDVDWRWIPAVADQDRATPVMDVLHNLRRQFHPLLRLRHPLVPTLASEDVRHAVHRQGHDDFADDRVQARAQAAASHDHSGARRRVEMELRPGTAQQHLVVHVPAIVALVQSHEGLVRPRVRAQEAPVAQRAELVEARVRHIRGREAAPQGHNIEPSDVVTGLQQRVHRPGRR
mmetsp:Transcript_105211/g.304322  ORF Transcript_105211/g.304322 Transcript_105211/m.304322 type:complete len:281 (-) Transcript_105211:4894-5736(-)